MAYGSSTQLDTAFLRKIVMIPLITSPFGIIKVLLPGVDDGIEDLYVLNFTQFFLLNKPPTLYGLKPQ